jgi:hypothetical protein
MGRSAPALCQLSRHLRLVGRILVIIPIVYTAIIPRRGNNRCRDAVVKVQAAKRFETWSRMKPAPILTRRSVRAAPVSAEQ